MTKKSTSRVRAMRELRERIGLQRHDVYAHPDDWPTIKRLADEMRKKREIQLGETQ